MSQYHNMEDEKIINDDPLPNENTSTENFTVDNECCDLKTDSELDISLNDCESQQLESQDNVKTILEEIESEEVIEHTSAENDYKSSLNTNDYSNTKNNGEISIQLAAETEHQLETPSQENIGK